MCFKSQRSYGTGLTDEQLRQKVQQLLSGPNPPTTSRQLRAAAGSTMERIRKVFGGEVPNYIEHKKGRGENDEVLKQKVIQLMTGPNPPRTQRTIESLVGSSFKRILEVCDGEIPNYTQLHSPKPDNQVYEMYKKYRTEGLSFREILSKLGVKRDRLLRLVETFEGQKPTDSYQKLAVASHERDRSDRKIKKMVKVLSFHTQKQVSADSLFCQRCEKRRFDLFSTSAVLSLDHIFGHTYEKVQHFRVLCANCHGYTINNRLKPQSLPADYISDPPPRGFDVRTINLLSSPLNKKIPSHAVFIEKTEKYVPLQGDKLTQALNKLQKLDKETKNSRIKELFIKTGYKKAQCECCGIKSWVGLPIAPNLEIHHIDGNNKNNKLKNLELLCANCHMGKHFDSLNTTKGHSKISLPQKKVTYKDNPYKRAYKSPELVYFSEEEFFTKVQLGLIPNNPGGFPGSLKERQVYAVLSSPNRPPVLVDCAKLLDISVDKLQQIIKTYWPSLWPSRATKKTFTDITQFDIPTRLPPAETFIIE